MSLARIFHQFECRFLQSFKIITNKIHNVVVGMLILVLPIGLVTSMIGSPTEQYLSPNLNQLYAERFDLLSDANGTILRNYYKHFR